MIITTTYAPGPFCILSNICEVTNYLYTTVNRGVSIGSMCFEFQCRLLFITAFMRSCEMFALYEGSQYIDLGTAYIHFWTTNEMNKIKVKDEYWYVHSRQSKFDAGSTNLVSCGQYYQFQHILHIT